MAHNKLKAGLAGAGIFAASMASGYAGYANLAVPAQMGTTFFATLAAKFISNVIAQMIVGGIFAALASALAAVALVSLVNLVMQRMTGPSSNATVGAKDDATSKAPAAAPAPAPAANDANDANDATSDEQSKAPRSRSASPAGQ